MKKFILIIIPFLLCACNGDMSRREIDEINIMHVLGIDYANGEYTVTGVYNISGGGGQGDDSGDVTVATGKGTSAYQAFEDLMLKNRKSVSIAHVGFYLVGDEAARNGIDYSLDFITRDETIKMEAMVFVTKDMKASDFIEQGVENKQLIHEELQAINQKQMESMKRNGNTIVSIMNEMDYKYSSLLIPYIVSDEEMFLIEGYAVIDNLRLRDYLDAPTSSGVNFVKNVIRRYPIFLEEDQVSLVLSNANTDLNAFLEKGSILVTIHVDFETQIKEVNTREDIFNQSKLFELTEKQNQYMGEIIEKAINYSIATRMDVLHISRLLEKQQPRLWKTIERDWLEEMGNIKYEYDFNSRITKSFIIGNER